MYNEDDEVQTPLGKAYVLEQDGDTVYVEMTNGVESDFNVNQIEPYAAYEARTAPAVAVSEPTMEQKLRTGLAVMALLSPAQRAAVEGVARKRINDTVLRMRQHEGYE